MEYKRYQAKGYTIHTIKTDKFKNCLLEIIFRNELIKDKITARNMVMDLICQSSQKYAKRKDIVIASETLYNTHARMVSTKIGNSGFYGVITDFLNPKYCEPGILDEMVAFPFELLLRPNIKNNQFDERSYNIVKNKIIAEIKSIKESPTRYAFRRNILNIDENSPSSYSASGYLEDLDIITPKSLVTTYQELLENSLCDIFVSGDLDMDYMIKLIQKYFKRNIPQKLQLELYVNNIIREKHQVIKEKDTYSQANLIVTYNIIDLTKRESEMVAPLFNTILGDGSLETKLFRRLREENSLCYRISSSFCRHDNLLLIHAGIDKNNFDSAVDLIKKTVQEMIEGNISEKELSGGKAGLISGIRMAQDSQNELISNYLFNYLDQTPLLDDAINMVETITKEELISLAEKLKLNTIYMLSDGDE